jgi:DNA polymerase III subunit beta
MLQVISTPFKQALGRLIGMVDRKPSMPIMSHVYAKTEGSIWHLKTSDADMALSTTLTVQTEGSVTMTLPAKTTFDWLRTLPDDTLITITLTHQQVQLATDTDHCVLNVLPHDTFPHIPVTFDLSHVQKNPTESIRYVLEATRSHMAEPHVRYFLNGVLLEHHVGHVTAVAMDGHRLASAVYKDGSQQHVASCVLPARVVQEWLKLTHEFQTIQWYCVPDTYWVVAHFESDTWPAVTCMAKRLTGTFPDYQRMMPERLQYQCLTLSRRWLKHAIQRLGTLTHERIWGVQFNVTPNLLQLSSCTVNQERATVQHTVSYDGPPVSVGLNAHYVADVLNALTEDTIMMYIAHPRAAVEWSQHAAHPVRYVMMPMIL